MPTAITISQPVPGPSLNQHIHSVLRIPELFDRILSFLDNPTLSSLARTCKDWTRPALSRLWDINQRPLWHLFTLLPDEVFSPNDQPNSLRFRQHHRLKFARTPQFQDYRRFLYYLALTSNLRFDETVMRRNEEKDIDLTCFNSLREVKKADNVVFAPRLRKLEWHAQSRGGLVALELFFSPTIRDLYVATNSKVSVTSFLARLPDKLPGLYRLSLSQMHVDTASEPVINTLVKVFSSLRHLQEVALPSTLFCSKIISCLSKLELQTLAFEQMFSSAIKESRNTPAQPVREEGPYLFATLRRLDIRDTLAQCIKFLDLMSSGLHTLEVHVGSYEWPQVLSEFFHLASTRFPNLREIIYKGKPLINNEWAQAAFLDPCRVDRAPFRPLLRVSLVRMELHYVLPLQIQNEDMEVMAEAWPNLEYFSFNPNPDVTSLHGDVPLSLAAVVSFINHCPKLQFLGLYVTTASVPTTLPSTSARAVSCLQELEVGRSGITAPLEETGEWLARVLPLEARLRWYTEQEFFIHREHIQADETRRARWSVVREALRKIQHVEAGQTSQSIFP